MPLIAHRSHCFSLKANFNYKKTASAFGLIASFSVLPVAFAEGMGLSEDNANKESGSAHMQLKVPSLITINNTPSASTTLSAQLLTTVFSQIANSTDPNGNISSKSLEKKVHSLIGQNLSQNLFNTLSRYGKAEVDIFLDKGYGLGGRIDWLAPVYETQENLLFSQIGVGREQKSTLVNIALGHRHFRDKWMLGYYAFLDSDVNNGYLRTGLGVEGWHTYTKLGGNLYLPLSKWKRLEQTYWDVRPARGYDLNFVGYLPTYPALGARLKYEHYFGGEVGVFSYPDLHSHPSIVTLGLRYTPIPLLTFSVDRRMVTWSQNEMQVSIKFNLPFNKTWSQQVRRHASVPQLTTSRYDMVERNNRIVLEYKDPLFVQLADVITGISGENISFGFNVTSKHPVTNIVWSGSAAQACGLVNGCVKVAENGQYVLILPAYQSGASNQYQLQAKVTNQVGMSGSSNIMLVNVLSAAMPETKEPVEPDIKLPLTVQPVAAKTLTLNEAVQPFMAIGILSGNAPYTFNISPTLPAGLSFDSTTGMISGTPIALSASTIYQVSVSDTAGQTAQSNFTLTVVPAPLVASVRVTRTDFIMDPDNDYEQSVWPFSVSGGVGPYTFSSQPALPAGLTFDAQGVISGGPQVGTNEITYTITATDSLGSTISKYFTLTVHE